MNLNQNLAGVPPGIARLKADETRAAGAWLRALLAANFGNLRDDSSLGGNLTKTWGPVVSEHCCICGELANVFGHHALSCGSGCGRRNRHAAVNRSIARAIGTFGTKLNWNQWVRH